MNTYLKYQPPALQFLAFLAIAGLFFWIDYVISSHFFADINAVLLDKKAAIPPNSVVLFKWAQIVASFTTFIIPAFLFGYFSSPEALPYIGIRKSLSPVILGASVVILVCVQPFIGWLGQINAHINFGSMQKEMLDMEAIYNRALEVFLQMKTSGDLFMNLLVMALLPAIGEELFFRGSLQKSLLRISNQPWLAILSSSVIFALLHGTAFKIIPIFTLGLLLGTVYHVTRNLWYTITIHFLNNAVAVLSVYYANSNETMKKFANDDINVSVLWAILSLVIVIGIVYFMKMRSDEVLPEVVTNEDKDFIA